MDTRPCKDQSSQTSISEPTLTSDD